MGKIKIIIQKEFNERVKKRSFILTTILTPLFLVAIMLVPSLIMMFQKPTEKTIMVIDHSGVVAQQLESSQYLKYEPTTETLDQIKADRQEGKNSDIFGVLVIDSDIMTNPKVQLSTFESSTADTDMSITSSIKHIIETEKLKDYNIENLPQIMSEVETNVSLQSFQIDESSGEDKESSSGLNMILSLIFGMMIYFFVFLYGGMVMQGVITEKSSKVMELMVSSVKPYELMMGKIIGIASVAILQFAIWMVVIFGLGTIVMNAFAGDMMQAMAAGGADAMTMGMDGFDPEMMSAMKNITDGAFLMKIFGAFIVYFIGGYLLYAAMFAAIGSAVDNEADTQQLQFPITIPLILAIIVMMSVMREPNTSLAVWFSMIPFTSPVVMMARIPYWVPTWELITSIVILYISFAVMVWLAGKIYRVGIFMYGKKPTFKEIAKWIRYKS
jgi:ABC-2 type transport system permease protein